MTLLHEASDGAASDEYAACADRWVGPFACLELANVRMAGGDWDGAARALDRARKLPQRHFSFHSWHQSAVREAQRQLKDVRNAGASDGGAGAVGEEEDAEGEGEETEDMRKLRAEIEGAVRVEEETRRQRDDSSAVPLS